MKLLNARLLLINALALVATLLPASALARDLSSEEYKVKAAFIYQFTNYIEWADLGDITNPFVIVVFGETPLLGELQGLAKVRTVKGRPIQIISLKDASAVPGAQMIVVDSDLPLLQKLSTDLKSANTLILSHSEGMASKGAMINFFLEGERLRFEINRSAMEAAKLKPSSQLLKLARLVTNE